MERQTQHGKQKLSSGSIFLMAIAFVLYCGTFLNAQTTFDPFGRSLLPQAQGVLAPQGGIIDSLGLGPTQRGFSYQGPQIQPRIQTPQTFQPFRASTNPFQGNTVQPSTLPVGPAFTRAPQAPPCGNPGCTNSSCDGSCRNKQPKKRHIIPNPEGKKTAGQNGQLLMTPSRIVAPVGSEVVILAGICGGDGYFVKNQPLEWILSNDSVGQIIQVGGMQHKTFNKLVGPQAKKFDGQYAWGRTGLKPILLSRGTPTPVDDIQLLEGQTYLSLSSESPGTTWITGVAPKAEGWDRRRASTRIHWVDGTWSIPAPISATAGTVAPLSTVVTSSDGSGGVEDWEVRYSIVGGAPAEFAPAGSQTAEATTDRSGEATVQIRQRAGQFEPGVTQVRVDVVRPGFGKEPELVVESGLTQVTWSAPALTIRAIGPGEAVADEPFNYRVEVTNPGDQLTRGVVVTTKDLDPSIEYISASPKPTQFGSQFEWELGDIPPGSQPRVIDVQLRSKKRGTVGLCFEVASESDRLRTEACAQTEIEGACIGLEVNGPEAAAVGDDVTYEIGLINQCEEPLRNVQLRITPDAGLVASGRASRVIEGTIEEIPFGEKKMIPVQFQAIQAGRQCFRLDVVADGGHNADLLECLVVSQAGSVGGSAGSTLAGPGLRLQLQGGVPIRVGESTLVRAVVSNTGSVPLNSVAIENRLEPSLAATGFSDNVRGPASLEDGEPLLLEIGRLEPGESVAVDVQYQGLEVDGNANMLFEVTSAEEANDTQELSVRIEPDGASDNRGFDPNQDIDPNRSPVGSDSGTQQQVPDFGTNPYAVPEPAPVTEPSIAVPQDTEPLGQTGLNVEIEASQQAISANRGDEAPVRFRVTNNDRFPHEDVNISMLLPQGLLYSNFDPQGSGLNTANQLFAAVDRVDFNTRRTLRPGESLQGLLYVIGRNVGRHPVQILTQSNQTDVLDRTDFVNVAQ